MATTFKIDMSEWKAEAQNLLTMSKNYPNLRLPFIRDVGNAAVSSVYSAYVLDTMPGHAEPTLYTGEYGRSIRRWIGPGGSWISIGATAPHAAKVEAGSGPMDVDPDVIEEWAVSKLGVEPGSGNVKRIIRKLETVGRLARRLMHSALHPSTTRGQALQFRIETLATEHLQRFLKEHGY